MTFGERLRLLGKGLFEGVKNAYSGYGNLVASAGNTIVSGQAVKGSDWFRTVSEMLPKTSQAKKTALDYSSRLAELAQSQAQNAYNLREKAGRLGSIDQGIVPALKTAGSGVVDTAKAVAYTAGLASPKVLLSPASLALTGGMAALRSKMGNEPFEYSFGKTLSTMPYYSGFAKLTDPTIGKLVDKTMKFSPIKTAVATRVASAVGNVAQGVGMDVASNMPTTPKSLGLDAVTGLLFGRKMFANGIDVPNAKGFSVDKNTMDEIIDAESKLKNPEKYIGEITGATKKAQTLYTKQGVDEVLKGARETIDRLAGKYLPNEVFDKTIDRPFAIIKKLVDLNSQNKLGNFKVGFAGEDQVRSESKGVENVADILKRKQIQVNDVPVSTMDKASVLSQEFGREPKFYDSLQNKGWSADKIYSVSKIVNDEITTGKIRNPEGFTTYLLRKLYPKDELPRSGNVSQILSEPQLTKAEMIKADRVAKELEADFRPVSESKINEKVLNAKPVMDEYSAGVTGKSAPILPDEKTLKTPEVASQAFQAGKDYFYGRLDTLSGKLKALNLTPDQFREAIENPQHTISKNVKSAVEEFQKTIDEALKVSGGETTKRVNYMPHIWEEDRILAEVLPNTFMDRMNLKFSNLLPRLKNAEGFISDPIEAGKNYVDRAMAFKYQAQIDAQARGIPVEAVIKEQEMADKLGTAIQAGDTSKIDIIKDSKEIEALKGVEIVKKVVKQNINTWEMLTNDGWRNLKKLGIYEEAFAPLQRYKAYANTIYKETLDPLIQAGDYQSAIKKIITLSGQDLNTAKLSAFMDSHKDDPELIGSVLLKATERVLKSKATQNLQSKLASYEFATGTVSDYVNTMSKTILGSSVTAKDMLSQTLGFINKTYASGALGLNFRSGLNNLFESKRVLAATDLESFGIGYKNAFADGSKILEKYGVQSKQIDDIIKDQYGNKRGLDILNKVQDATLIQFQKSEELKDKVFLYAFENAGIKAGKSGVELTKYVLDNFEKYANKFGGLGTIGMFNNKWVRTMLQFSQYGFKELQTIGDTAIKAVKDKDMKSVAYLAKLAGTNAILHTITGALYGARFEEIWGSLPVQVSQDGITMSFGPLPSLFEEIYLTASNANTAIQDSEETGEPVDWNRIWTNKLKQNLALFVPAGNQLINKTGKTVGDMLQGYNASASDRVRFLAPETAYDKAIGLLFGAYSTRQSKDYFNNKEIPLGENQSETFKELQEVNPESAKSFYKDIMQSRDDKNKVESTEKVTIEQILKGEKPVQSPEQGQIIQSRQNVVSGLVAQGISDPYEIGKLLDEQAKASGFASSDMSTSEIKSYITLAKSPSKLSVMDILQKNTELSDKRELMTKVLTSTDGGFEKMSEQQKMQYLSSKGIGEQDVKDFMLYKLSNAPVKDRADYIVGNSETNFAQLYKDEVLTAEVAKELERKGYIPSADKLMDQMKMTDPYYIKQYQVDLAQKKAKVKATTMKEMLKAGYQARKDARTMLTKRKKTSTRKFTSPKLDTTLFENLAKPKSYNQYKPLEL